MDRATVPPLRFSRISKGESECNILINREPFSKVLAISRPKFHCHEHSTHVGIFAVLSKNQSPLGAKKNMVQLTVHLMGVVMLCEHMVANSVRRHMVQVWSHLLTTAVPVSIEHVKLIFHHTDTACGVGCQKRQRELKGTLGIRLGIAY